ncbi:CubicO group peptidase (beta-lactamase class C family) [Streptomyces sp. PanSC19]|uniref:serine hydrolase domain-containing protein n=1 Tax=Streptomyces sp. PanSC19 TaxID=1520455 RepID=UPI000F460C41|nr:serine hydrolase domain-containing protein [Streptomyces sp. PanSC19]ROQ35562.1 CubicO group peptidase (beta-lactamase class C family) [Streptomyces sp. PanSC19]
MSPLRTRTGPLRSVPRSRRAAVTAVAALLALCAPTAATGAPAADGRPHRPCVASRPPERGPARDVLRIAERAKAEMDLKSVILRVTVDGREVVTAALGESMTGVPAAPALHFRNGNIAISYMGTALLRLVDRGVVRLDDPVARWLPGLKDGDRITLRMLAASTTGLVDYVRLPEFQRAVVADPFRRWTADELVRLSTSKERWYEPGTNWSYSHANFVLLGAALEKITDTRLDVLLRREVLGPLRLRETRNGFTPDVPAPVLHAFTSDRGTYEESTFWNPSWTTAPGAVETTDICDLARSAAGIGSGRLLSPSSYRELLDPGTVGLGHATEKCPAKVCLAQTEAAHDGLGVLVLGDWVSQHPLFFGYSASQNYLPSERLAIAVSTTDGPNAVAGHSAHTIARRIAAALAPAHPVPDFG